MDSFLYGLNQKHKEQVIMMDYESMIEIKTIARNINILRKLMKQVFFLYYK